MTYKKTGTGLKPSIIRTTVKFIGMAMCISTLWACPDDEQTIVSAKIQDALRLDTMGLYYKNFLEAYGLQEFKDKTLARQGKPTTLADTLLYRLLDLEKNQPDSFRIKYGGIDSAWVNDYKPDSSLFIPQIIGQLIKLEEGFEKYSLKGERTQKAVDGLFDEIYTLRKRKGEINEKEKPFMPEGNVDLIVRGDKERQEDWDDRVDFCLSEPLLNKYFAIKMHSAKKYLKIKNNWNATAAVVDASAIKIYDNNIAILVTQKLEELNFKVWYDMSFCDNERFASEPSLNIKKQLYGTCYFINSNFIITNAHVVIDTHSREVYRNLRFIKNFQSEYLEYQKNNTKLNEYCIYEVDYSRISELKKCWVVNSVGVEHCDWAVVPVKNIILGAANCQFENTEFGIKEVSKGQGLYSIGHPLGLSKKFVYDGEVFQNQSEKNSAFLSYLDLIGGTSGSPVFNSEKSQLVGVVNGAIHSIQFEVDTVGNCLSIKEVKKNPQFKGQVIQKSKNFQN